MALFCFYFSTLANAEDFCYSRCKIQVTVGLILDKKRQIIKLINWIAFNNWLDRYIKQVLLKINALKQYRDFINLFIINLRSIYVRYFVNVIKIAGRLSSTVSKIGQ